ncbi:hypothetical protein E2C01_096810 [Portunus trituberculatus]|uniref:Uncharacterized protein n=1 Tax=Portunus trituberculatus TaxID=210409 RepID=A0A5B7K2R1_PORTR|nr:hypothetical protein [Portunus trituberculatus]
MLEMTMRGQARGKWRGHEDDDKENKNKEMDVEEMEVKDDKGNGMALKEKKMVKIKKNTENA